MYNNMGLLLLVACSLSAVLVVDSRRYGAIQICKGAQVKYVKPGEDFDISCRSDHAITTRIYMPSETVPSDDELLEDGHDRHDHGGTAERTTTTNEYEDATKEEHDGFYTCVVQHGSDSDVTYSIDECEVRIVDLCEDADCADNQICEPNYDTGTVKCTCNYGCPTSFFDVLCSDTCEVFWNECAMNETSCKDKKARRIANKGFCPGLVKPDIRHIDEDIECEVGEQVTLASGLVTDGTPSTTVQWIYYPEVGGLTYLSVSEDTHVLECNENTAGTYTITLMHCLDEDTAVRNEYRLSLPEAPSTEAPSTTPTGPTIPPEDLTVLSHVCSLYPGGVIEDFNSGAHFYDLSCTHVLAADFMPDGNFYAPWFIYGTFDQQDGKTALSAMTFYLGNKIFEFQRGWIVHTGEGNKLALEEDVAQTVKDCYVVFSDRHLNLDCEYFTAHYDGLMSGHIKLKTLAGDGNLQKGRGNIGLCFDSMSGWRTNWQVGNTKRECKVDRDAQECIESASCDLAEPEQVPGASWSTCGVGANAACDELNCEGADPSPAQECALKQANRINCSLKMGMDLFGQDESCPEDPCEWMVYVVSEGCPQDNLPFVCPGA